MSFVHVTKDEGIATVTLARGKVNAINEALVDQLHRCFADLEDDPAVRAVILTGDGKFFSFGFDVPELIGYSRDSLADFLTKFTGLYTYLFLFPKPVVAACNGHTTAAGCMLAIACDHRIMVTGRAKISLNEITFGASVFAGSVEMLKFCVGGRAASEILYGGAMYRAETARELGLVDEIASADELMSAAHDVACDLAGKHGGAFRSIKRHLRQPVAEVMMRRESDGNREFMDVWFSESTWRNLQEFRIRS